MYLKMSSKNKKAVLALKQTKRKLKSARMQKRVQFKRAITYRHISFSANSKMKAVAGISLMFFRPLYSQFSNTAKNKKLKTTVAHLVTQIAKTRNEGNSAQQLLKQQAMINKCFTIVSQNNNTGAYNYLAMCPTGQRFRN